LHESGTVIFHRKYQQSGDSKDIILRSGLISALYSFAKQVEKDALDSIRMEKVTLFFKKRSEYLFVLFLDSRVNPTWLRKDMSTIQNRFFERYPEIQWHKQVVNLSMFNSFKEEADKIVLPINNKMNLILFLIDEALITEEDYVEMDLETIGSIIGSRIVERNHDIFVEAIEQDYNHVLERVDEVLEILGGEYIERNEKEYTFLCHNCMMCDITKTRDCFIEGVLESVISTLSLDLHIKSKKSITNLP
jgi:hypothetical protein